MRYEWRSIPSSISTVVLKSTTRKPTKVSLSTLPILQSWALYPALSCFQFQLRGIYHLGMLDEYDEAGILKNIHVSLLPFRYRLYLLGNALKSVPLVGR
jgi:hypothetical protein